MFVPDEQVMVPILTPHTTDPAVSGPWSFWVIGLALVAGWAFFRVAKPERKKHPPQPRHRKRR